MEMNVSLTEGLVSFHQEIGIMKGIIAAYKTVSKLEGIDQDILNKVSGAILDIVSSEDMVNKDIDALKAELILIRKGL